MKKVLSISVLSALLLVGCKEAELENTDGQQETEAAVSEEETGDGTIGLETEEGVIAYEWKTNYTFLLDEYITRHGFFNLGLDPNTNYVHGVVAAKAVAAADREVPYFAILYVSASGVFAIPSILEEEELGEGVFLDIWDVQNGKPVRIEHRYFSSEGELSEYTYEKELTHPLLDELEGELGISFEFGEISDVTSEVLATFATLNSDNVAMPKKVLPIEELALTSKLVRLLDLEELAMTNGMISPEEVQAGWRQEERIFVASALGSLQSEYYEETGTSYGNFHYKKSVVDFYSESNFGFVLDEKSFPSIVAWRDPAFRKGEYIYPDLGDSVWDYIQPVVDVQKIEKHEDGVVLVQYERYNFDSLAYGEETEQHDMYQYVGLPKFEWPSHFEPYMTHQGPKYALFQKNQYGFALLKNSDEPITEFSAEADHGRPLTAQEQERFSYIASLQVAYDLAEAIYSGEPNTKTFEKAYEAWDTELNKIYGLLREKLSAEEMENLKDEQLFWIEYRDELAGDPAEVGEQMYWKIRLQMTIDQTLKLIDRYFFGY